MTKAIAITHKTGSVVSDNLLFIPCLKGSEINIFISLTSETLIKH